MYWCCNQTFDVCFYNCVDLYSSKILVSLGFKLRVRVIMLYIVIIVVIYYEIMENICSQTIYLAHEIYFYSCPFSVAESGRLFFSLQVPQKQANDIFWFKEFREHPWPDPRSGGHHCLVLRVVPEPVAQGYLPSAKHNFLRP